MKQKCPIVKEECWEHGCTLYTHLIGNNPQTGVQEDKWGCAIAWLPVLLIENAGQLRKTGASMDKVATEVRGHHATFIQALPDRVKERIGFPVTTPAITNGDRK